jgi:glycosyl transferase family 25
MVGRPFGGWVLHSPRIAAKNAPLSDGKTAQDRTVAPHIHVITLPHATARQASIRAQLDALGLPFSFVDGVVGADLPARPKGYNSVRRRLCFGKDLTPGEIGCFLAHRRALQAVLDSGANYGVICEDDVTFQDDTAAVIEAVRHAVPKFDLVRMTASDKTACSKKKWRVMSLHGNYGLYRMLNLPGGGWAYMVSRRGAECLLNASETFWMPFDTLLAMAWHTGTDSYHLLPSPILHEHEDSMIGEDRFARSRPSGLMGALYRITRPIHKSWEVLGRLSMAATYKRADGRFGR